ncbi:hypothetical protein [Hymenobacter tenuis]
MDNAAHIQPGQTFPACNRCQYIARSPNVECCPYCGGNWTHDVTRPASPSQFDTSTIQPEVKTPEI